MRVRLRPAHSKDELAALYAEPHQHNRWPDHRLRVDVTVQVARFMLNPGGRVADLSCGDAAIARQLDGNALLGDLAPGYRYHGPIEQTITEIPSVDLFLCCETLEHLDNPDLVLAAIRPKTRALVLSTPDGETTGHNREHYWGWNSQDVAHMLKAAGFTAVIRNVLELPGVASYQIWGCK